MAEHQGDNGKDDPRKDSFWRRATACHNALHTAGSFIADFLEPWRKIATSLATIAGLVGGVAWWSWPSPRIDPELTIAQPQKPEAEAHGPLQCVNARSISEAHALLGGGKFDEMEANHSKNLSGRKICGRGWAGIWEHSVTTNDADYVILRDPNKRSKKMQVRLARPTNGFRDGSPVWITDATFDVLPKSEALIAIDATIEHRELASKPTPSAQKKTEEENVSAQDTASNGDENSINFGIFQLELPRIKPPKLANPEEERSK